MTIREELRGALTNVLSNASNYPGKVQARLLGQDMGPLTERVTDTALAVFEQAWSHEHTVNVLREDWERLKRFEQAHTPTEHECTWACWVDRYGQDHHAPTDDEREYDKDMAVMLSQLVDDEPMWSCVVIAKKLHAAGFRRPVHAEPQEADADPDTAFELGRVAGYDEAMREVQAEPTDAFQEGENR